MNIIFFFFYIKVRFIWNSKNDLISAKEINVTNIRMIGREL